jgi:hypothetical protein
MRIGCRVNRYLTSETAVECRSGSFICGIRGIFRPVAFDRQLKARHPLSEPVAPKNFDEVVRGSAGKTVQNKTGDGWIPVARTRI